jgi:hypothetical protein
MSVVCIGVVGTWSLRRVFQSPTVSDLAGFALLKLAVGSRCRTSGDRHKKETGNNAGQNEGAVRAEFQKKTASCPLSLTSRGAK